MCLSTSALLLLLATATNQRALDDFSYADASAAQAAWVASPGTPPVEVATVDGKTVLQFQAPFASDDRLSRTILDRKVQLDLASAGEFTLEIAADPPEAAAHLSLYFRSGGGWYSGSGGLRKSGWQTVRFSKSSFHVEDQPAGWNKIDGIRLSVWRGQPADATIRLRRLAAAWHDVALVVPSAAAVGENRELASARHVAQDMAAMLGELGLGTDAVEDTDVIAGALSDRRVAIVAYHPSLSDDAVAALIQFVEAGGKVFICYSLPPALGQALGFARGEYYRPEQKGSLAEIRFEAAGVAGLPASVHQASWNIATAQPAGHGARVIGRWFDADGNPTGHAAMLISDRGAYFSHIVLNDDRENKKAMLAAVLGHLYPPLWREMVEAELARLEQVGHCTSAAELVEWVGQHGNPDARQRLDAVGRLRDAAAKRFGEGDYPAAIALVRQARQAAVDAYLRAQQSPPREGRAWWNHSGTGAYPGDWERTARELAQNGFNMILPNMLWAGRARYASDVLPRSATYQEYGDQIAQCVAAAKKYGIEVHVWKVNYNLSGAPKEFVEQLRRQGRLQVFAAGKPQNWLCPSNPQNLQLEIDSMLEVARKYDVDGLHFDYIRYPGSGACYCDGCRRRFEAQLGRKVEHWPEDCHSGKLHAQYLDWRCDQITKLVRAVSQQARKIKPGIKISAAVFGSYPSCRESVGQDWPEWIKAGYLDFVCPMDYTESDVGFRGLVANQLKLVGGRIPLYPGIGATASRATLSADRVAGQIHYARELGAAGFTIFNLTETTAGEILPGLGLGATSKPALPPHK